MGLLKEKHRSSTQHIHTYTKMASEADVQEAFRVFDTRKEGKIPAAEIGTLVRALGKAPLESEVDAIIDEIGDSPFDEKTLQKVFKKKMKRPMDLESDMKQAFKSLDNLGNGKVSEADLRVLLGTLGEALDGEEVDSLLRCCEVDEQGNIEYDALVDMLVN